jgi:hypothetical protein
VVHVCGDSKQERDRPHSAVRLPGLCPALRLRIPIERLKMLALACFTAIVAFSPQPNAPLVQRHPGTSMRTLSGLPVRMIEPPTEEKSVEEVTEKFGLEAGLFSALKRGGSGDGKSGSMQQAGDLLKRYGGAYLLTSTSLAAVSFALCYWAVENGVDVGALLSKVGIQVSDTSTTAGTVGIAYVCHKAASPIRFPPTVALTPIVARTVFGRTDIDDDGEAGAESTD